MATTLKNHHRRVAIISYHIGKAYGLSEERLNNLVIAAALHDIGALTVSERDELIKMDVENPQPHARLGSYMLDSFAPFHEISRILYYHHWSYNRDDQWVVTKGKVPVESYSGSLFHPDVISIFLSETHKDSFWLDIDNLSMDDVMEKAISESLTVELDLDLLEQIAQILDYPEEKQRELRVAGLLHDIGKIAIPSELIEKNGKLTPTERTNVQAHAYYTDVILRDLDGVNGITAWAAHHHENHDGSGYPENLTGNNISEEMDILSYADIYTALSENRPYRTGLSQEEISVILKDQFKDKHGEKIYQIIIDHLSAIDDVCKSAIRDGENRFEIYEEVAKQYEND